MALTRKKTLKYVLLPQFLPRIGKLFGTGFYHVAFLVASIFLTVRLLPREHPYLNPNNMGRFGVRHVIAEAARNLQFNRANIDQIIVFITILSGMVLILFQFTLMIFALVAQPSIALAGATFADWFLIPSPSYSHTETNDIALMLLDRVFGVTEIFNSCISNTANPCIDHRGNDISEMRPLSYPTPLHLALHRLLSMYSYGISIMSLMIILYFVITIIGETAVTGSPFGQRFNRAWVPVRLVLFFALLAPLNLGGNNAGLNGAQLITLWTAKLGSNFASNAWGTFTTSAETPSNNIFYEPNELIAIPSMPEVGSLAQFFSIVQACVHGQKIAYNKDIFVYLVRDGENTDIIGAPIPSAAVLTFSPNAVNITDYTGVSPDFARNWSGNSPPHVVIGEQDVWRYSEYRGGVKPICGEIFLPFSDVTEPGSERLFQSYWLLVLNYMPGPPAAHIWNAQISGMANCLTDREVTNYHIDCDAADPYTSYNELVSTHLTNLRAHMREVIEYAVYYQVTDGDYTFNDNLQARGWAGAGIWFNNVAQMNGSLVAALHTTPVIKSWPIVMETIKEQQRANAENLTLDNMFSPALPDNSVVQLPGAFDEELARAYYKIYQMWNSNAVMVNPDTAPIGNPFIDAINTIFGTNGLFDMRADSTGALAGTHDGNASVHPLALLSSLGRSMVDAAIRNFGIAVGTTLGGGLLGILQQFAGLQALLNAATSFLMAAFSSTIMIGIMLGYILPLLPFIYMFFALGSWVKSIFEAIVAMPIWALAHIRIDGDGMPGPGATNGYFLLLEIFIRPILILTGLIASLVIFGAVVQVLNQIFDIMVVNVGGVNREDPTPAMIEYYRGPIDELFFTIMYASICYMVGISCFKMVDEVPNLILRWMGVSVSTFKENAGDPAGQLSRTVYSRGQMGVEQLGGSMDAGKLLVIAR